MRRTWDEKEVGTAAWFIWTLDGFYLSSTRRIPDVVKAPDLFTRTDAAGTHVEITHE